MRSTKTPVVDTLAECPWWCTSSHDAPLHVLEERDYRIRGHYGRERVMPAVTDEEGIDRTAATALVCIDNLDSAERGPVTVNAICEGLLAPEQAARFAAMIAAASAEAAAANAGTFLPTSDQLHEVVR